MISSLLPLDSNDWNPFSRRTSSNFKPTNPSFLFFPIGKDLVSKEPNRIANCECGPGQAQHGQVSVGSFSLPGKDANDRTVGQSLCELQTAAHDQRLNFKRFNKAIRF